MSGILLMLAAIIIYLLIFGKEKNLVSMKGFFTLSWVGGQGIACLQLSYLQKDWANLTWICFFLAYICFSLGYDLYVERVVKRIVPIGDRRSGEGGDALSEVLLKDDMIAKRLLICIIGLAVASLACFVLEAIVVGFIPFFSELPHAYSYFHISGVHYFTVSCILIPAITVIYFCICTKKQMGAMLVLLICNIEAIAIPILCVSRFQLLFAVGFAVVTYVMVYKKIKIRTLLILGCAMVPAYVVLTIARNHDVTYLNGIFEMKNQAMPIFISQPYIYVANNFENFNCMVEQLAVHSMGLKMLFPVFALTGLKFVFPQLVTFPIYITKTELTTLTMFYDAYYDFGVIGIILLPLVIGITAGIITNVVKHEKNPIVFLLYGQFAIYLGLSFFTTWFSNPTTWFWFALTFMMYLFVGYKKKEK